MQRQLLPASTPNTNTLLPPPARASRRRSSKNITVACNRCRQYKSKCDGSQPVCSGCIKRGHRICNYESENSRAALRQRNESLIRELAWTKGVKPKLKDSPNSESSFSSAFASLSVVTPRLEQPQIIAHISNSRHPKVEQCVPFTKDITDIVSFLKHLASTTTDESTRNSLLEYVQRCARSSSIEALTMHASGTTTAYANHALPGPSLNHGIGHDFAFPSSLTTYDQADGATFPSNAAIGHIDVESEIPSVVGATALPQCMDLSPGGAFEHPFNFSVFTYPHAFGNDDTVEVLQRHDSSFQSDICPMLGSLPLPNSVSASHFPQVVQDTQAINAQINPYAIELMWLPIESIPGGPARWASRTFIEIRDRARWMIRRGIDVAAVIGPTSLESLLDNSQSDCDRQLNISDWAQAFTSFFPHLSLANRVACWSVLHKVISWQAHPTRETFERVPIWCRPGLAETYIPHMPISICLAWPKLREYFVHNSTDWVEAVMGSISVSWPHPDELILQRDEVTGFTTISPFFEEWIGILEHWSINEDSAIAMSMVPGLREKVNIRHN